MTGSGASIETGGDGGLRLSGALSFATVRDLLDRFGELPDARGSIRIDLAQVTRADSAGVALLIEWMRLARAAGREIVFVNIPAQMLAIARVSGLDQILPLQRT